MKYSGQIRRTGPTTSMQHAFKYSVIQIGDENLTNVVVPARLKVFISEAQKNGQSIKIHLTHQKVLAGVEMENGEKYAVLPSNAGNPYILLVFGLLLIPLLIGIPLCVVAFKEMQLWDLAKGLRTQGFKPI